MSRFGSADRLASWAGLCPGNHERAGTRKSGKTRKGNHLVRSLLCESANAARRTQSGFASKYKSLAIRRGHKKAHAMAVSKNAPRWIRALKQFGYWPTTQTPATA
jgi:transposase